MPSLPESVNIRRSYGAWSGTGAELGQLLGVVARQLDDVVPHHVAKETKWPRQLLADAESRVSRMEDELASGGDAPGHLQNMLSASVARARKEETRARSAVQDAEAEATSDATLISVAVTHRSIRRSTRGTADEIADYVASRPFDSVEFAAPAGTILGYSITLEGDREDGLVLRIASRDDRWATAADAYIDQQIRRSVPWWRVIRSRPLLFVLWALTSGFVAFTVLDIIATLTEPSGSFDANAGAWAWTAVWSIMLGGGFGLTALSRRQIRAFDVVAPGKSARGRAVIAVAVSSIGAIVLSVIATRVTDWLSQLGV